MIRVRNSSLFIWSCILALSLALVAWVVRGHAPTGRMVARNGPSQLVTTSADLEIPASIESGVDARQLAVDDSSPLTEMAVPPPPPPIMRAKKELDSHSLAALDGVLYVDEVMDQLLEFASLPVSEHPDLDYHDNDSVAYRLEGTPEGVEARVLIGMLPYEEDGRTFRYLQMSIESTEKPEYLRDSVREGTSTSVSISYDVTSKDVPTRFALLVQRRVDLAACRDVGLDAYAGRFTLGASFAIDLEKGPDDPKTATFGLVDGNIVDGHSFDGVSPLAGDIQIDRIRLATLLGQLHKHLSKIRGE